MYVMDYKNVTIGKQVWIAEKLKVKKLNDTTGIPLVTDAAAWSKLSTSGYCWYNNDAATYKGTYGALYNWYSVNTGKLCPVGWHVPRDADWTILITFLGGFDVAGGKLKEIGTSHWSSPNIDATNEYGFTAVSGGVINSDGSSSNVGIACGWWPATENSGTLATFWSVYNYNSVVLNNNANKRCGASVRCIKD